MKAQILTEDQIPEALSIARGVFDYCLRARITDLEMIHIFLQYTENTNIRNMIAEGTLTMWGIFEQGHMIAMSGMQKEGHITMLYVLPVFQRRGCGRCLLEEMKAYAANQYQLQRVTLSAMPAWTADYYRDLCLDDPFDRDHLYSLRQGCITAKADQHPDRGLRFVHGSISQGQPECIGYGRYKTDPEYIRQRKFGDCRRSA